MEENNSNKKDPFKGLDFEAYFAANDKRFEGETIQSIIEHARKRFAEDDKLSLMKLYPEKFIPFLIWRELRQFYSK